MTFLKGFVDTVVSTVKKVGQKARITEIAGYILGQVPVLADSWRQYKAADGPVRVKAFWQEFDDRTGLQGPDLIHDIPPDEEERLFDGIKNLGEVLCLWAVGAYGKAPDDHEFAAALSHISKSLAMPGPVGGAGSNEDGSQPGPASTRPENNDARKSAEQLDSVLAEHQRYPSRYTQYDQMVALREAVRFNLLHSWMQS